MLPILVTTLFIKTNTKIIIFKKFNKLNHIKPFCFNEFFIHNMVY